MKYESCITLHDFWKFQTIRAFGDHIYNAKITIREADQKQSSHLNFILDFDNIARPRSKAGKEKNKILMKTRILFLKVEN